MSSFRGGRADDAPVIRDADEGDRAWVLLESEPIGGPEVVSDGRLHRLEEHPTLIAVSDGARVGYAVYRCDGEVAELLAILATRPGRGIGTALLLAFEDAVRRLGCGRVELSTTHDNDRALGFYRARGYDVLAIRTGAFRELLRTEGLDSDLEIAGRGGTIIRDEIRLGRSLLRS